MVIEEGLAIVREPQAFPVKQSPLTRKKAPGLRQGAST